MQRREWERARLTYAQALSAPQTLTDFAAVYREAVQFELALSERQQAEEVTESGLRSAAGTASWHSAAYLDTILHMFPLRCAECRARRHPQNVYCWLEYLDAVARAHCPRRGAEGGTPWADILAALKALDVLRVQRAAGPLESLWLRLLLSLRQGQQAGLVAAAACVALAAPLPHVAALARIWEALILLEVRGTHLTISPPIVWYAPERLRSRRLGLVPLDVLAQVQATTEQHARRPCQTGPTRARALLRGALTPPPARILVQLAAAGLGKDRTAVYAALFRDVLGQDPKVLAGRLNQPQDSASALGRAVPTPLSVWQVPKLWELALGLEEQLGTPKVCFGSILAYGSSACARQRAW